MSKEEILNVLAQHQPADQQETADVAQIRTLVEQHYPSILSRAHPTGHLTGSALVMDWSTGRFLLHYHKKLNRWLQFGGHVDDETDMAQVALREAYEESGLPDLRFLPDAIPVDIDIHTIPATESQPAHLHLDFRYLLVTRQPDRLQPLPGESDRCRWLDAVPDEHIDAALERLIRKALAIFEEQ